MKNEEETEPHVIMRCILCGGKFDSKYDKIPTIGTYKAGDVHRSLMHCDRCKRRVDVKVIKVR